MKVLTALILIVAGALTFGWSDLFHLVVGLPVLVLGVLLLWGWNKRMQASQEDSFQEEEGQPPGRRILAGAVTGLFLLLLLAVGFPLAARTRLVEVLSGRDCPGLVFELGILQGAGAHEQIVRRIDRSLQGKISCQCRDELLERRARALLSWAESLPVTARIGKLRDGIQAARQAKSPDLPLLAETRLRNAEQQEKIGQQQQEIENQRGEIGRQRGEIERQSRDIERQRLEIGRQHREIERLSKLLEATR